MEENRRMKTICFGEILFDVFPSCEVLGGAPLNVAVHLSRLGCDSLIISSIGCDERGERALSEIARNGLSDAFIHRSSYPTGIAQISILENRTEYEFNDPAAWDDIVVNDAQIDHLKARNINALVFGTLALRSERNVKTLERILSLGIDEVLYDVNLRKDFFSKGLIDRCTSKATILKMNKEEAAVLALLYGVEESFLPEYFLSRFKNLKMLLITEGASGLSLYTRDTELHVPASSVDFVDSVGAGDSVSAAFLNYYLKGYDLKDCLEKASILAGAVVSTKGATSDYPEGLLEALA